MRIQKFKLQNLIFFILLSLCTFLVSVAAHAFFLGDLFTAPGAVNRSQHAETHILERQARGLDPKVLSLALKAYHAAKANGLDSKSVLTIIDFSKPSTEKRLWVIDMRNQKLAFNTLVAHGKNSGDNMTRYFSNAPGSKASSLGVFLTGNTYMGGNGYSLELHGLEKQFNDNAFARRVVIHGAPYVNEGLARRYGRIGRSWGCPALDEHIAPSVINYIKKGTLVFAYYPDKAWLRQSRFLKS